MKIKEAKAITGGLSSPSKMPCKAFNISAFRCKRGNKLANVENSVCSICYARKGRYSFTNVKRALTKRLLAFDDPYFVEAMVTLINKQSKDYFRWFDSGDLQSLEMLETIVEIARKTPNTKHWLPTRERLILCQYTDEIPNNLNIRVSTDMIDQLPKEKIYSSSMTVSMLPNPSGTYLCNSKENNGKCGNCRACWNRDISIVAYEKH